MDRCTPRRFLAVAWCAGALALTACSGGGADTASSTPVRSPSALSSGSATPSSQTSFDPDGDPIVLALGDSLAAGYVPTGAEERKASYAGLLTERLAEKVPGLSMTNLACTGETTGTFLEGGKCGFPQGSQLKEAITLLHGAGKAVRLITLDIGANDALACVRTSCPEGLAAVQGRTNEILKQLRAAAPSTPIALITYYNPFVVAQDASSTATATTTPLVAQWQTLNDDLTAAAAAHRVTVVALDKPFDLKDQTKVRVGTREMTREAAAVCALTYVCTRGDIHLNPAGHRAVADAVFERVQGLVAHQ